MMIDNSLLFSNNQAITGTAVSTKNVDLTGFGSGNAPSLVFGGSTYGADMGIGDGEALPKILCSVTATFNNLTSLVASLQGAPDNGSNAPGTYSTYAETGAIPLADLVAGNQISTFDLPRVPDGIAFPRFLQMNYTVNGTAPSQGALFCGIVLQRQDLVVGKYGSNFVVA